LKLLADLGKACKKYQDDKLRNLKSKRVQCDEIWSFVPLTLWRQRFPYRGLYNGTSKQVNIGGVLLLGESERLAL